jgi:phosphatidylserine/phosphatidylglycerophosphate/cardiolipin synthase-like enzyme
MWKHDNSYSVRNRIELVKGGACYFELLRKLIASAKHSIYIRVYIWSNDATGTAIAIRKAAQNIPKKQVAVLLRRPLLKVNSLENQSKFTCHIQSKQ